MYVAAVAYSVVVVNVVVTSTLVIHCLVPTRVARGGGVGEPLKCARTRCAFQVSVAQPLFSIVFFFYIFSKQRYN